MISVFVTMKKAKSNPSDCLDDQMTIFDTEFGLSSLMMNADLSNAKSDELLSTLDLYVKDPGDTEYQRIRAELTIRLQRQTNPFGAGAPARYTDDDIQKIKQLKQSGKTNREIAKTIGCSVSTISRIINH